MAFPEALGEWTEASKGAGTHINRRYTGSVRVFGDWTSTSLLGWRSCDVVLDPLRSAVAGLLELFQLVRSSSCSTTNIEVQLTRGMYEVMGDPCPRCIALLKRVC